MSKTYSSSIKSNLSIMGLIIFVASMYCIFNTFDKAFVVYGLFYFAITLVTMLVTIFIIRRKEKQLQTVLGENDETK